MNFMGGLTATVVALPFGVASGAGPDELVTLTWTIFCLLLWLQQEKTSVINCWRGTTFYQYMFLLLE
jgi:hypothetical protein